MVALGLLAGCTATPPAPTPTAGGSVQVTSAAATPSVEPTVAPLGEVPKDPHADLEVSPVSYSGLTVVVATFGEAVGGRAVSLQRRSGSEWQEVSRGEQSAKGKVEFHPEAGKAKYRAVALAHEDGGRTLPAVSTPSVSAGDEWKAVFTEDFKGSRLSGPWSVRFPGLYYPSRWCSASSASMVKVKDGVLSLGVAGTSAAKTRKVRANAARANGKSAAKACPNGVYDNGMVSTEGRYLFTYGTVAVRVKFPVQRGMHAGAWLQTVDGEEVEIDFIESFGFGSKGAQNMLHPKSAKGERLDVGDYVTNEPGIQTREWWDEYHVVSMDWSPKGYVFRMDGVETFRTSKAVSKRPHFFVLSLLSSDYETDRLKPDQLPASFKVDWVKIWQRR